MATPFVPNPRTAPTMVTDQRDYINTTTQRIKADVKEKIAFWEPEAAPLTVFTKRIKSRTRTVTQYSYDWLEKEPHPRLVQVSGAQTAGDVSIELGAGQGARISKYAVMRNQRTEEVVWVSAVTTDTLTATRAIGGGAAAMNDGDTLELIAFAYEDGSAKGTLKSVKENREYNLTQIFRRGYGFTGRQQVTGLYGGRDPVTERRWQAIEHRKDIEKAMFWGKRHDTTGPNGRQLSFSGGANFFIRSNRWNLGGVEPTERQFIEWMEYAMRWGMDGNVDGSGSKLLFASPRWQTIIENFGRDKVRYTQGETTLGLKVGTYESIHGTLKIIRQPIFTGNDAQYAFMVDPNHVRYVYLNERDTKLVENIQANDVDGYEEEWITDCGSEWEEEAAHAVLYGIPV